MPIKIVIIKMNTMTFTCAELTGSMNLARFHWNLLHAKVMIFLK